MDRHTGSTYAYESWFYLARLGLGLGNLVNWVTGNSPHLDLAFTAWHDFYFVESDVLFAVESQSFHHFDRCLQSRFLNGEIVMNGVDMGSKMGS